MRTLLLVFACFAVTLGNVQAQEPDRSDGLPSVALPPALDRLLRNYERAWAARDARALAELFTHDGFVLRTGVPPVRGRAAIERAYRDAGGPLHLRALAFARDDSVAYIVGGYRYAPGRPDGGKFVLALRRGPEGRWLIEADMDNQND